MDSITEQVTKTDVGYEIPTWNNWSPLAKFYHPLQAGSIDGTDTVPHDKAVIRAMLAKYKPNKRVTGDPESTLFVGKLSKDTSEATVYKVFAKCGDLTRCRLVRDVVTGFSRGYAFVEYRSDRDANVAWRELHGKEVDGSTILVEYEAARSLKGWIPRRLAQHSKLETNTNIYEARETTRVAAHHVIISVTLIVTGKVITPARIILIVSVNVIERDLVTNVNVTKKAHEAVLTIVIAKATLKERDTVSVTVTDRVIVVESVTKTVSVMETVRDLAIKRDIVIEKKDEKVTRLVIRERMHLVIDTKKKMEKCGSVLMQLTPAGESGICSH